MERYFGEIEGHKVSNFYNWIALIESRQSVFNHY